MNHILNALNRLIEDPLVKSAIGDIKMSPPINSEQAISISLSSFSDEVQDLLRVTTGIDLGIRGYIDFLGQYPFEFTDIFPKGVPLLPDDFGNFWVLDVIDNKWGGVFFISHDPLALIVQADTLPTFLEQIQKSFYKESINWLQFVKESANKPFDLSFALSKCSDPAISEFAESIPSIATIYDLRLLKVGSGFSFSSDVWRYKCELIFGAI
jgi:hypothetical protein